MATTDDDDQVPIPEGWNDSTGSVYWSFEHFYYLDKANACIHLAPVKFSPVTFRLAELLVKVWPSDANLTPELVEVTDHIGSYEEDPGR